MDQKAMEFAGVGLIYTQTDSNGPLQLSVR